MPAILIDVNVLAHVKRLRQIIESDYWNEIWLTLGMSIQTFTDQGLSLDISDALLWSFCQQNHLILITANRNDEGPESLEATIRHHNTPNSLPVFTLADAERVRKSKDYADRVVESLLQYLLEIDNIRGSGRIYLP